MKTRIKIRLARDVDIETLVTFCRNAHDESVFSNIEFSEPKVRMMGKRGLDKNKPREITLVAEINGRLVGYSHALTGEYFAGTGALLTTVDVIYVKKSIRKSLLGGRVAYCLAKSMKQCSRKLHSSYCLFHVTSGIDPEKTDGFLRKLGAKTLGGNYII